MVRPTASSLCFTTLRTPLTEATKDRAILHRFFSLLREHFGRPDQLGATRSTSPDFINLFMESARPDLWRNSDCLFKEYAFSGTFTRESERRRADVLLELCLDNSRRPIWLRKIDVHFPNPDPETIRRAQALFQQLQEDIRRIRGPRT